MSDVNGIWYLVSGDDGEHDGIGDLIRRTCHERSFLSNRDALIQKRIIVYPSLNFLSLASRCPQPCPLNCYSLLASLFAINLVTFPR